MRKQAVISLNAAVLLFGTAGLFARWIQLPAICIAFGRVLFSSAALAAFMLIKRQDFRIPNRKDAVMLTAAGAVLALHWWAFMLSVQLSSVAVGTVTFCTFPLFLTFLEPLVSRSRPTTGQIMSALFILAGVVITALPFSYGNSMLAGTAVGIMSAVAYAVLTIMNKGFAEKYSGTKTAFYEQGSAAVLLLPFAAASGARPGGADIGLLVILGVVTTAAAHSLFISSLRELPAQLAGVCSSLETVYGILFAFLFLKEAPTAGQMAGGAVIAACAAWAQSSGRGGASPQRGQPGRRKGSGGKRQ